MQNEKNRINNKIKHKSIFTSKIDNTNTKHLITWYLLYFFLFYN